TITAVTLRGQHQSAILKGGHNTFVGVGVRVEDFHGSVAIDRATMGDDSSSAITLVDSTIEFATDSPGPDRIALRTIHSAYTENVYVRNATAIVAAASGSASIAPPASAGPSDWVHLVDGSLAIDFGTVPGTTQVPTSHIWGTTGCDAGCRQ